jgi:hypothetical protein
LTYSYNEVFFIILYTILKFMVLKD